MIQYYSIRMDTHDRSFIDSFLAKYSTGTWLYCLENGMKPAGPETVLVVPNPHCHIYMESTFANTTLRVPIRKAVGSGNKAYSLVKCDHMPMKYFAYIVKEGRYYSSGISEETLKEALEYDDKVKEDMKNRKKRGTTVLQKIIDHYGWDENPPTWLPAITESVILYYKETGTLVREFAIISQVQTICLRYVPEYKDLLVKKISQKVMDY